MNQSAIIEAERFFAPSCTDMVDGLVAEYRKDREMLKPDYKPFKTSAVYMSDLSRDAEWFYHV